jgi:hypothetical protein
MSRLKDFTPRSLYAPDQPRGIAPLDEKRRRVSSSPNSAGLECSLGPLLGTDGASAVEAIEEALTRGLSKPLKSVIARSNLGSTRALAALARLRGDEAGTEREEAEARRILLEMRQRSTAPLSKRPGLEVPRVQD